MITTKPRAKTCRNKACAEPFFPQRMGQKDCSRGCEIIFAMKHIKEAEAKRARAEAKRQQQIRKEDKQKLQALKGLSYWEGRAQKKINEYVRLRDANEPCISCGITHSDAWHAGHYIAVGANSTLRFNEDNIHKQCLQCNHFKGGNHVPYRANLLVKVGQVRVEALEGWHAPVKSTIEQCQTIGAEFDRKTKSLLAARLMEAA